MPLYSVLSQYTHMTHACTDTFCISFSAVRGRGTEQDRCREESGEWGSSGAENNVSASVFNAHYYHVQERFVSYVRTEERTVVCMYARARSRFGLLLVPLLSSDSDQVSLG
jgi:hypothetical protein